MTWLYYDRPWDERLTVEWMGSFFEIQAIKVQTPDFVINVINSISWFSSIFDENIFYNFIM